MFPLSLVKIGEIVKKMATVFRNPRWRRPLSVIMVIQIFRRRRCVLLGVCRNPAVNSLSGNIWIQRILLYSATGDSGFQNQDKASEG